MLEEYKSQINLGVGAGLLLQIVGRIISTTQEGPLAILGALLMLGGAVILIWGLCMYAKAKGYSAALGLLGLLSIIGLIILVCLPDRMKDVQRRGFPVVPGQRR